MAQPPSGLRGFAAELKRRRVFRVAAGYAVAAFALLQGADIVFPALGLPDWSMTLVVVLAFLGVPVACALGWAFDLTSDGVVRAAPSVGPGRRWQAGARWGLAALTVVAVTAGGLFAWQRLRPDADPALDGALVAVVPFRVAGAEPSLAYLREGMLDLLAAKLTGETGPRAVDPRTLTAAWRQAAGTGSDELSREQALALARGLGAGRLVLGEVVSMPGRVVLTASLSDVASGRTDQPVSVEGPLDRLPELVDRLVAGLLSVGAGESERLASLTTTSLPALRLYLEGQAAYRSGNYDAALARFDRSVELDSTFALAALMKSRAGGWLQQHDVAAQSLARAWRHRERLGPLDRAFLATLAGPRYPAHSPARERIAAWERLIGDRPDSPEVWFEWGDALLHWGTWVGIPDTTALRRSAEIFDRALNLDSLYLPALGHLVDVALIRGDTAAARRYTDLYLARDTTGLIAESIRQSRAAMRSPAALPEIVARVDSVGGTLRRYTLNYLTFRAEDLHAAAVVADHLGGRISDPDMVRDAGAQLYIFAANRGRSADAERYLEAMRRAGQVDSATFVLTLVRNSIHWDADPQTGARAAAALAGLAERWSADSNPEVLCVYGQWLMSRGDAAGTTGLIASLRAAGGAGHSIGEGLAIACADLLETWRAVEFGGDDAAAGLAHLDSLLATGWGPPRFQHEGILVLAGLLERRGDLAGAHAVLGRYSPYACAIQHYCSTLMHERGRIAALLGDHPAAIEAYRYYIALRADAEPRLHDDVLRVRAELARLAGD